jgi:hypothetical protein
LHKTSQTYHTSKGIKIAVFCAYTLPFNVLYCHYEYFEQKEQKQDF